MFFTEKQWPDSGELLCSAIVFQEDDKHENAVIPTDDSIWKAHSDTAREILKSNPSCAKSYVS